MKHYSIEERQALLKEYESSGETVKQFCERYSIPRPTLYYWMNESPNTKTKKQGEQDPVELVQVETSVFQKRTFQTPQITIKKAGMEILLPLSSSVEDMKNVFEALSAV